MEEELHPDDMDHAWSNYCLYCKTENYTPFGLQLLHYCINCGLICEQCHYPKPIFAFPYDPNSVTYQEWRVRYMRREPVGPAPNAAHLRICSHCHGREEEKLEKIRMVEIERQSKELIESPQTQAVLDAILESLATPFPAPLKDKHPGEIKVGWDG